MISHSSFHQDIRCKRYVTLADERRAGALCYASSNTNTDKTESAFIKKVTVCHSVLKCRHWWNHRRRFRRYAGLRSSHTRSTRARSPISRKQLRIFWILDATAALISERLMQRFRSSWCSVLENNIFFKFLWTNLTDWFL